MAPLVPVTIAFAVGILLAKWLSGLPVWLLLACGALGAIAGAGRRGAAAGVIMLWLCLGALRAGIWQRHSDHQLFALLTDEPQAVALHGTIGGDPAGMFDPDESGRTSCVIRVDHARMPDGWRALQGQVRATLEEPGCVLAYGDEVVLEGAWSRVPAPSNPGQYDWRAALARERIHGLLRVRPYEGCAVLRRRPQPAGLAMVQRFKSAWIRLIRAHASRRNAGLLMSLLLGQRAALDEDLKQAFRETGTIHLLVISGFNVGLVAMLLELAGRWLGIGWRPRL